MQNKQIGWSQESILLWGVSKELEQLSRIIAASASPPIGVFTATVNGLVPAPGTPTGRVLSDSGAWLTVGGGGTPSLTTVGTSGLATLTGSVLNIPNYSITVDNGLTRTLSNIQLGGTLIKHTDIDAGGAFDFSIGQTTPPRSIFLKGGTSTSFGLTYLRSADSRFQYFDSVGLKGSMFLDPTGVFLGAGFNSGNYDTILKLGINALGSAYFRDNRVGANQSGIEYFADYSATLRSFSLTPKIYVDTNLLSKTEWKGDWIAGTYQKNQQVLDNGYLAIANKATSDRPAPQPIGIPGYVYAASSIPTASVSAKQVIFGNRYAFSKDVILEAWRVNVIAGNNYSIYLVENPLGTPIVSQIINYTAQRNGWVPLNVPKTIIRSGSTYDLVATVTQPAPPTTTFTANYNYKKPSNSTAPNAGDITQAQNQTGTLRISKTDSNAIDRTAQLATLAIGDKITGDNTIWAIQSVTSDATSYSFVVSPATQLASTGTKTFIFSTTAVTPITYPVAAAYWATPPAGIVAQGLFTSTTTYFAIVPNNSAYGTDILVQDIVPSADWDIQAFSITGNTETPVASVDVNLFSQVDYNLPASSALQKSFDAPSDAATLDVGVYRVSWLFGVRNLSHANTNISIGFMGTAANAINSIKFSCNSRKSNNPDIPAVESGQSFQQGQLNTLFSVTEFNNRNKAVFSLDGIIRILVPGTLIPAVKSNAFNTGTAMIEDRQLFQITKLNI